MSVYESLVGILDGVVETSTITVKITVLTSILSQCVVAAERRAKEDQESEFLYHVLGRTSYINWKLIDFDVAP